MASNFDNAAWFYDELSRLVYGRSLADAQVYLVSYIQPNSKILIVGGGTGRILEDIAGLHNAGLQITYVEVSRKMMALSKKRNIGGNVVTYLNDAVEQVKLAADYDVVLTPFLFDNFTPQTVKTVFEHIHEALRPGGMWLNADFQFTGKWWQNVLLKSMFLFFRVVCGIEASQLPDVARYFEAYNYIPVARQTFFGSFIASRVYRK